MQNTPVQAICSRTMIHCSSGELQRTVAWKNRVGKRFKERGQGLRHAMWRYKGTRFGRRTWQRKGVSNCMTEQSSHQHAKSLHISLFMPC